MRKSLLVYDGSNPLFRTVMQAVTDRSDEITAVRWDTEPVQAFLDAQFDARPFAFMLVEGDAVHVGAETIARVLRRMGIAEPLADVLKHTYAAGGVPVGRLIHGRTVADINGTFPLSEAAAVRLADLREVQEIPVEEGPTGER
ncbi:MAG: hypothetical protein ABEI98_00360 [Halorhabdus sp.]